MEPEGSIPNSQELSTCSYPEDYGYTVYTKSHDGFENIILLK
jgi:hypothetical protein